MLFGIIPKQINPSQLVEDLNLGKKSKEPVINGIIYLLSKITYDTIVKEKRDSYSTLNKSVLQKIIGKGHGSSDRVKLIKNILLSHGIIETKEYVKNKISTGFRFKPQFRTEDLKSLPYGDRISTKIKEFDGQIEEFSDEIEYPHLNIQFDLHSITFNNTLQNDIKQISSELLQSFNRKLKLKNQSKLILINYIGRLLSHVKKLEDKSYNLKVIRSNHRYNSFFTNLPKVLRNYILINNSPICEIDIKSSQPYLLSTILNSGFSESIDSNGYNMKTIYPDLFNSINSIGFIHPSNNGNQKRILGCYFNDIEFESLKEYSDLDFTDDFYSYLLNLSELIGLNTSRDKIKDSFMSYLFDRNELNRDNHKLTKIFEHNLNGLNVLILKFITTWNKREFSILLQRTESYLLLSKVTRDLFSKYPNTPIFTIHDSVITNQLFGETIHQELFESITQITNKPVGLKLKNLQPNLEELSNDIFKKTNVSSQIRFKELSGGVFKSYVDLGYNFLIPEGDEELKDYINDIFST